MFGASIGKGDGRRGTRTRKVSQRMAVVDDATRQQAAQARLEALENDNDAPDPFAAHSSDDEFVLDDDGDEEAEFEGGRQKKKRKGAVQGKRKTRGMLADRRGPRSFKQLLEESGLEQLPAGSGPNYMTAVAGPPVAYAARKFCSVCGQLSPYTCARCGARFCNRKCYAVHSETRCLKFMA